MHSSFDFGVSRPLVLAIPIAVAGWFLSVPALMTPSSYVALLSFLAASTWILKTTYVNAQPASSLAQSLHDVEVAAASATRVQKVR